MNTIHLINFSTKKVTQVQTSELAKEMLPVKFEGDDQVYFVDGEQFKRQAVSKHLQLMKNMEQKIEFIKKMLQDLRTVSYFRADEGLGQDVHPEDEISMWWLFAAVIDGLISQYSSQEEQADLYRILVAYLSAGSSVDLVLPKLSVLHELQVGRIIEEFESVFLLYPSASSGTGGHLIK